MMNDCHQQGASPCGDVVRGLLVVFWGRLEQVWQVVRKLKI